MPLAEDLKKLSGQNKNNYIKTETFNAIVDALKENTLNQPGYGYSGNKAATRQKSKGRSYFFFTADESLPFRSIFGAGEFFEFNDPPIINAINIGDYGITFNLFTNILPFNLTDIYGLCRPIGYYEPVLLNVTDEEHFPTVGMPCGPDRNPEQWGISAASFGLICISPPGVDPDNENNVWCVRTNDPASVIGTIFETDVPAFDPASDLLGQGSIILQYRNSSGQLENATGPDGEQLTLPVYNASASSVFKANTLVKCICVIGVGLVIIDSSNLVWGRADDNIPHFSSGKVNVYRGIPGNESLDGEATPYMSFNHLAEVVKDEWCFLTSTGDKNIPYYIVQNEYNGMVLGKINTDARAPDDVSSETVNIYGGQPGAEVSFSTSVKARLKNIFGAITKNSWTISTFLGPDAEANHGGWYITAAQRGNLYTGKIKTGQADQSTQWLNVGTKIKVRLYTGDKNQTDSGLDVDALVWFAPLLENEWVQLEWNGDIFVITKAELDGGFYAKVVFDIEKQGVGYINVTQATISQGQGVGHGTSVNVDGLQVFSALGKVKTDKLVWISRNSCGFFLISSEC